MFSSSCNESRGGEVSQLALAQIGILGCTYHEERGSRDAGLEVSSCRFPPRASSCGSAEGHTANDGSAYNERWARRERDGGHDDLDWERLGGRRKEKRGSMGCGSIQQNHCREQSLSSGTSVLVGWVRHTVAETTDAQHGLAFQGHSVDCCPVASANSESCCFR